MASKRTLKANVPNNGFNSLLDAAKKIHVQKSINANEKDKSLNLPHFLY